MKYFDLTHTFKLPLPVYPGEAEPTFVNTTSIEANGYIDIEVTTGLHVGTHIDAPAHMIAGGKLLSDYLLDRFIGRGVLVDARGKTHINHDLLRHVELKPDDIVLVLTGWSKYYRSAPDVILDRKVASATAQDQGSRNTWIPDPALRPVGNDTSKKNYFNNYPIMEESFAEKLIDAQVSMLGIDTPSPDQFINNEELEKRRSNSGLYPIHHLLLEADILITENLNNLEQLANAKEFEVIALPTKFAADAAPTRVIARVT